MRGMGPPAPPSSLCNRLHSSLGATRSQPTKGVSMPDVALGSQGLTVSRLGLGCMGMSRAYGEADDEDSVATLQRALDLGVTFLDTADMYGWGHNEELVGRAIKARRDEVSLATKFGNVIDAQGNRGIDGSPEHVR